MQPVGEGAAVSATRKDPLRRLRSTPLSVDLGVMERTIRLETNSPRILDRTLQLFARYPRTAGRCEFRWRLVSENDPQVFSAPNGQASTPMSLIPLSQGDESKSDQSACRPSWPQISAFSDSDLRIVSFGQRSFLAVNLAAREALGYLAESLLDDAEGFTSPFLSTLFLLTAGALRLTPLAGACVTLGEKALLVLGEPNNGKTTSSYWAGKRGLDFYSDRAVFLDMDGGRLRLWGDFCPASFRWETREYLPELSTCGRVFRYRDTALWYVEEGTAIRSNGHPVRPVSCVFLERNGASAPHLARLDAPETLSRLAASVSFRDDARFAAQQSAALAALARVPACRLAYASDPAVVVPFFRNLLVVRDFLEGNRQAFTLSG